MRRSVGWHFFLYSLAIILVAIVAVGAVTLILVNANFNQQEEQYLLERGDQFIEPLQSALRHGGDPADLQDIASLGLVTGQVRIRVMDANGRLLADSGSYGELFNHNSIDQHRPSISAFQLLLDESGHLHGFRRPTDFPEQLDSFMMPGLEIGLSDSSPFALAIAPQPPFVDVSDAAITLPLLVDSQVVGQAELSEGPAFGQAIRDTLQQALIIGGLVALLVAAVAAVVAARQVTRPLLSLGTAADEMAQGNLQARAKGSKLAELDHLAKRFNSMADQLETTIASLESERLLLKRFIADASHELRTPLTALKTFNSLLLADLSQESERSAELLFESGRQLDHLDRLTTDLLDLSRLEARLNGIVLNPSDIRPAVEGAVATLRQVSLSKSQTLVLKLPPDPVIVAHDPAVLQRAIQNLVSNAVKFTGEGGHVWVSIAASGRVASIHIQDDGPGIPSEESEYIFDRFYRGRGTPSGGSGLGLAIAREIATIHSGSITFTSEEGAGSHFILELPLALV